MAKGLSILLATALISAALPSFGQSSSYLNEQDVPKGWVEAPSSKANPDLWECAGYGGSQIVSLEEGSVRISTPPDKEPEQVPLPQHLKLSKEMIGSRSLLRTADGWLVGFDGGEFGGGLWWFNSEGDENQKLLSENVHAIYHTRDGVFVLVGLAHLSLNSGKIYEFTETAEGVRVTRVADLVGSPEASTVDSDGRFVVATPRSVVAVDRGRNVRELYKSGEDLTYPTSVVVDANGDIFVGMRFFILRLVPGNNGDYRPQWLMAQECKSFKVVKRTCMCGDSHFRFTDTDETTTRSKPNSR
jgi:hypothetical protein